MYKYSQQNAAIYSKLGIKGTTYQPGFEEIQKVFGDLTEKTALDYGSGAGRTAKLLLSFGAKKVIGVDHNESMIEQAKKEKINDAEFHLIEKGIPLKDHSIDVALCAHVLVEVGSFEIMEQVFSEVHRVLKPGGVFVIITNNSKAIGKKYISFEYEKYDKLKSGQKIPITIKGEKPFVIDDYFWFEDDYKKVLEKVGFEVEAMTFPIMSKEDGAMDEAEVAPHVVIKSIKK